jgi:hypothetical protein
MEWMAEVETEASLSDPQIADKWMRTMKRGIPFYLLVPRGLKDSVQKLKQDASLVISCIYEYTVINGVCHILSPLRTAPVGGLLLRFTHPK